MLLALAGPLTFLMPLILLSGPEEGGWNVNPGLNRPRMKSLAQLRDSVAWLRQGLHLASWVPFDASWVSSDASLTMIPWELRFPP